MKTMRALTLVVSSYFLFSVQAFAINGNFRTLMDSARNAQTAAEVAKNPTYSQPAIWTDDCNKQQLFHRTKVLGTDTRRQLIPEEEKQTTGTGYFFESNDKDKTLFGNGVVAEDRSYVLTAAHLFVKNNEWLAEMKSNGKVDFTKAKYFSPVCGKEYEIEDLKVLTMDPDSEPNKDIAFIKFRTPLCAASKPNKIEALNEKDLSSLKTRDAIYVAAYRSNPVPTNKNQRASTVSQPESGRPAVNTSKTVKHIAYGQVLGALYSNGTYKSISYSVDTEGGTSGAGLAANYDEPVVFGINRGGLNDHEANVATLITPAIEKWVKTSISLGKIQ